MESTRSRETPDPTTLTPMQRVAAGACVGGAVAAIPFGRLHGWGRVSYAAIPGVLGAVAMGLRTQEAPAVRLRVALLLAGAGAAGQNLGIVLDRAVERWLRRRGVRHPRLVLAGVGAVYGALTFGIDTSSGTDEGSAPEAAGKA